MKHLFIINPAAGKKDQTAAYEAKIRPACEARGLDYEIAVSTHPGNCRTLARRAAETGEEVRLYACGGDGTLNEIVNGAAGFPNAAVTHFAGGSGNDFVKIFTQTEPFRDINALLDEPVTEDFDLIRCGKDLAVNVCSVGFDARIGTDVAKYKKLPFVKGFGAYALSAVVNTVKRVKEHYIVRINGEVIDGSETLILAANGRYYGGGFHPVPDADPQDGKLDVLLVKGVSRGKVLEVIGKYKDGRYADFPDLIRHLRADRLSIQCDDVTPVNLDGELRLRKNVDIEVAEEKLRFFHPACVSVSEEDCVKIGG